MSYENLARTGHAVGQNCFHMIWCPKHRYPVFRFEAMRRQCEDVLREIATEHNIKIHELCVEADHLHLFVEIPHTMSLTRASQHLKGRSAYLLRKRNKWMRKYKALWEIGKFYRSVGSVTDEAIQHYVLDTHHITKIPKSQKRLFEA